ncbi:hypothetical protein ABCR94_30125, partial [Streptomyces sp. 21So2-11]|uniref:hypothetical protein n=1 Tax=Streptomyces sp. 21So2-11 TaxID=3144408 RepID=UPI0032197EE0
ADGALREVPDRPRSDFEAWPDRDSDLYDFLPMAFVRPILLPELSKEPANREVLVPCFEFIEGLASNEDEYIQGALYFEVYEQFLRGRDVLAKALEFSLPVTRSSVIRMLTENYPETFREFNLKI